jgi:hypothetical protein
MMPNGAPIIATWAALRQAQEKIAQQNAQIVRDQNLDPDILYWPQDLTTNPVAVAANGDPGGGFFDPSA